MLLNITNFNIYEKYFKNVVKSKKKNRSQTLALLKYDITEIKSFDFIFVGGFFILKIL